jgi:hypothetical protein
MDNETGGNRIAVDAAVRALDPLTAGTLGGDELETMLDALGAAIVTIDPVDPPGAARAAAAQGGSAPASVAPALARPRGPRRRRSLAPRGTPAVVVAVALLALGAAAYAGVRVFINANTGRQLHGWQRKTAGPGDLIDLGGTDVDQVLERVSADIPFPKGYGTWRTWQLTLIRTPSTCPPGSSKGCTIEVPAGQIRERVAGGAFCAWVADWQVAKRSDDTQNATEAEDKIRQAPSWKAVTAVDRHAADGRGWFGWINHYRAAVASDDVAAVDRLNANRGCARTAPPAGSHDGTVVPGLHRSR